MRKTPLTHMQLGSLLERDETPESGAQSTIDQVLSTPNEPSEASLRDRIAQLSAMKTPKTLPRVAHTDMKPKDAHQTTTSPPDTAFKLGFADICTNVRRSIASVQNSPTKYQPRQSLVQSLTSPSFDFKFAAESNLSDEAQKLMENVRDEAARIKAQMLAEKKEQDCKDEQAERLFGGVNAAGRKIARPRGKAGRFSDIHMAEFKKMDSIANHASSFRAQPGFAQPTSQSLKRSGSRAGLDEPERPRTAGKGTPGKPAPPFMRQASASPFKPTSTAKIASDRLGNTNTAKRMRQSELGDVSSGRPMSSDMPRNSSKPSGLPRVKSTLPASIFSPTQSSLGRSASTKIPTLSQEKKSSLPRSNSVRSLKGAFEAVRAESSQAPTSPTPTAISTAPVSKLPRSESTKSMRPLPPLPVTAPMLPLSNDTLAQSSSIKNLPTPTPKTGGLSSRLPTFAGLRSILRPSRAPTTKTTSTLTLDQTSGTPKHANTTVPGSESAKKVDFTPSTKSRYAVKLAAATPSPSKLSRVGASSTPTTTLDTYDSAAYTVDENDEDNDEDWEDAESEVAYPTLPSSSSSTTIPSVPSIHTFLEKAKQHNRRESKEFKSIFTTLEHPSRSKPAVTLTDVNTRVNQTNPGTHANIVARSPSNTSLAKPSPSTIRRVRTSSVAELVQPFEDAIKTVPHGLPGKKRRRESDKANDLRGADEDAKENRRLVVMPQVSGGWEEEEDNKNTATEKDDDEGEKRGGKRARVGKPELEEEKVEVKKPKPNAAREAAAKNAKERKGKGKGILSLSRLNMLARPKERK
jgi:hypothetical protein